MPPKKVQALELMESEIHAVTVQQKFVKREIGALLRFMLWPGDETAHREMKSFVETGRVRVSIRLRNKTGWITKHLPCPAQLSDILGSQFKWLQRKSDLRIVSAEIHELKLKALERDQQLLLSMCSEIKARFNRRVDDSFDGFCDRKIGFRFADVVGIIDYRSGVVNSVRSEEESKFLKLPDERQISLGKKFKKLLPGMRNWVFLEVREELIERGCLAHVCSRQGSKFYVNAMYDDRLIFLRSFEVDYIARNTQVIVDMIPINEIYLFLLIRDLANRNVQTLVIDVFSGGSASSSYKVGQNLTLSGIGAALSTSDFERRDIIQLRLMPLTESEKAEMEDKLSKILFMFPTVIVNLFMKFVS